MPYAPNDYDTAVSAFNVLPESLAVENLIRLRQGNEAGQLNINKARRDEANELSEGALSDSFGAHLSATSHLPAAEQDIETKKWMSNNSSSYASKAITDASAQVEFNRNRGTRAAVASAVEKKASLDSKTHESDLTNFEADQQVARDLREAQRTQAIQAAKKMTTFNENEEEAEVTSETLGFAGSIKSLPLESQQKLNEYLYSTEGDPDKKAIRKNLVRLSGILEGSSQLKTAQGYMKEEHAEVAAAVLLWRGKKNYSPPQNDTELESFNKRFPGKIKAVLSFKEDNDAFDSVEKSVAGLNRKLAGGEAIVGEDGVEIEPAMDGLVDRLLAAQEDKTPAGRKAEAKVMGEMMSMALPAAGFIQERIRLHESTIKSRADDSKSRKLEVEIEKLEAQVGSTKSGKSLIEARTATEKGKSSQRDKLSYLRWISADAQQERLNDADEEEMKELKAQLNKEWDFMSDQLKSMGLAGEDTESNQTADEDPN